MKKLYSIIFILFLTAVYPLATHATEEVPLPEKVAVTFPAEPITVSVKGPFDLSQFLMCNGQRVMSLAALARASNDCNNGKHI